MSAVAAHAVAGGPPLTHRAVLTIALPVMILNVSTTPLIGTVDTT